MIKLKVVYVFGDIGDRDLKICIQGLGFQLIHIELKMER